MAKQSIEANLPAEEVQPPPVNVPAATTQKTSSSQIQTQPSSPPVKEKTPSAKSSTPPAKKAISPPASRPKTKTSKPTTTSTTAARPSYYIQVGAYSNRNSARILAEKLRAQGYPAIVLEPFPSDRRPLYRVRIGGYTSRTEALQVKDKLARAEGKKKTDYFIVKD